jgi:hypothetical protein
MHWVGFALVVLVGVILYWFRCRHRFWYGVGEIVVAFLLLYIFFFRRGLPPSGLAPGPILNGA